MMLLIYSIGMLSRWNPKESSRWDQSVFSIGNKFYYGTVPLDKSRCNGSTLVQKNLLGNHKLLCERQIQSYSKMKKLKNKVEI